MEKNEHPEAKTQGGHPVIAVSRYHGGWYGIVEVDSNVPVYHKPIIWWEDGKAQQVLDPDGIFNLVFKN